MKLILTNENYCWTVVKINQLNKLEWLDKLVWVNIFWYNVLTWTIEPWTLMVLFTAETKFSEDFLRINNMYSSSEMNEDKTKKWYIWKIWYELLVWISSW